ncbi:NYN domain-containing protein [Rhodococcus sp. LW-XY12]|uniref:NYN domain-containing protein n=1 Tax=Rhodococcus sp. LW-XY12 TaxID=2856851 RepID=UPI00214CC7DF|nr:NYN domain-containing protein [Rhodococcus sp. LW-XY12]
MTGAVIAGNVVQGPALHLIDIENLCNGRVPARCAEVWDHYLHQVGVSTEDQITVAVSRRHAAEAFFTLPATARRILVPNTPNAADDALLESVQTDRVGCRHRSVVIASGDGAFAPLARALRAAGIRVTQVVTEGVGVSGALYRSCEDLIRLPEPGRPVEIAADDPRDLQRACPVRVATEPRERRAPTCRQSSEGGCGRSVHGRQLREQKHSSTTTRWGSRRHGTRYDTFLISASARRSAAGEPSRSLAYTGQEHFGE